MSLRGVLSLFRLKFSLPSIIPGLITFIIARYHYGVLLTEDFFIAMLVIFLVTSAGLIINQYHDYWLDLLSQRTDLPLVRGKASPKTAKFLGYGLFIPAVLLTGLISVRAVGINLVASFFAIAYSASPLRFKARPFVDSFTNGLTYGPLVMALVFESLRLPIERALLYSFPFFIFLSAGHMLLAVPTIEKDLSLGARTSAAFLGEKRAIKVGMLLFALSSAMAVFYCLSGYYPLLSLSFLPFMAYSILQLRKWLCGADWKEAFRRMETSFLLGALAFLLPFFL